MGFNELYDEMVRIRAELAAVKAEQNHQNKGVMDLQDKYGKVVAERDRLARENKTLKNVIAEMSNDLVNKILDESDGE